MIDILLDALANTWNEYIRESGLSPEPISLADLKSLIPKETDKNSKKLQSFMPTAQSETESAKPPHSSSANGTRLHENDRTLQHDEKMFLDYFLIHGVGQDLKQFLPYGREKGGNPEEPSSCKGRNSELMSRVETENSKHEGEVRGSIVCPNTDGSDTVCNPPMCIKKAAGKCCVDSSCDPTLLPDAMNGLHVCQSPEEQNEFIHNQGMGLEDFWNCAGKSNVPIGGKVHKLYDSASSGGQEALSCASNSERKAETSASSYRQHMNPPILGFTNEEIVADRANKHHVPGYFKEKSLKPKVKVGGTDESLEKYATKATQKNAHDVDPKNRLYSPDDKSSSKKISEKLRKHRSSRVVKDSTGTLADTDDVHQGKTKTSGSSLKYHAKKLFSKKHKVWKHIVPGGITRQNRCKNIHVSNPAQGQKQSDRNARKHKEENDTVHKSLECSDLERQRNAGRLPLDEQPDRNVGNRKSVNGFLFDDGTMKQRIEMNYKSTTASNSGINKERKAEKSVEACRRDKVHAHNESTADCGLSRELTAIETGGTRLLSMCVERRTPSTVCGQLNKWTLIGCCPECDEIKAFPKRTRSIHSFETVTISKEPFTSESIASPKNNLRRDKKNKHGKFSKKSLRTCKKVTFSSDIKIYSFSVDDTILETFYGYSEKNDGKYIQSVHRLPVVTYSTDNTVGKNEVICKRKKSVIEDRVFASNPMDSAIENSRIKEDEENSMECLSMASYNAITANWDSRHTESKISAADKNIHCTLESIKEKSVNEFVIEKENKMKILHGDNFEEKGQGHSHPKSKFSANNENLKNNHAANIDICHFARVLNVINEELSKSFPPTIHSENTEFKNQDRDIPLDLSKGSVIPDNNQINELFNNSIESSSSEESAHNEQFSLCPLIAVPAVVSEKVPMKPVTECLDDTVAQCNLKRDSETHTPRSLKDGCNIEAAIFEYPPIRVPREEYKIYAEQTPKHEAEIAEWDTAPKRNPDENTIQNYFQYDMDSKGRKGDERISPPLPTVLSTEKLKWDDERAINHKASASESHQILQCFLEQNGLVQKSDYETNQALGYTVQPSVGISQQEHQPTIDEEGRSIAYFDGDELPKHRTGCRPEWRFPNLTREEANLEETGHLVSVHKSMMNIPKKSPTPLKAAASEGSIFVTAGPEGRRFGVNHNPNNRIGEKYGHRTIDVHSHRSLTTDTVEDTNWTRESVTECFADNEYMEHDFRDDVILLPEKRVRPRKQLSGSLSSLFKRIEKEVAKPKRWRPLRKTSIRKSGNKDPCSK